MSISGCLRLLRYFNILENYSLLFIISNNVYNRAVRNYVEIKWGKNSYHYPNKISVNIMLIFFCAIFFNIIAIIIIFYKSFLSFYAYDSIMLI